MAALFYAISLCFLSVTFGKPVDVRGHVNSPPTWSNVYTVAGVLRLPYAEIVEPFQAFFDGQNGRSRIDFYGGMDKTYQRADVKPYGASYRICPETTETQFNVLSCFEVNGTEKAPVAVQTVLPDLSNFEFVGYKDCKDQGNCSVWTYVMTQQHKVNTYTVTVTVDAEYPVHYEMLGYDTLLGSHYDKYEVEYRDYSPQMPPPDTFEIKDMTCKGFPGPGVMSKLLANPMQEFIEPDGQEKVHELFEHFLIKHPKKYANMVDRKEHNQRRDIFRQNLRFINSHNRKHVSFQVAVNHLADRSPKELGVLRGRTHSDGYNGGLPFHPDLSTVNDVPDTLDWRLYGAVTPVKDQAVCGSCWSFGSTGAIEGALFLKTKNLVRLSQQNLMDCSWGFGNNGCDGGEEFRSYQWVMKHGGIATEHSYGQYLAQDGYCHNGTIGAKISGYVNVTSGDLNALKIAIFQNGPVAVGIDASHKSFAFYSFGVYYEPQCGNKPDDLDHAVLAVGYGTMNDQAYWLVKNSWSTHWGNAGYVLMSQKDNNCGVATDATFVHIE
ncbi:hypothetical protein ACROYT_G008438 [Oculina patagonica]